MGSIGPNSNPLNRYQPTQTPSSLQGTGGPNGATGAGGHPECAHGPMADGEMGLAPLFSQQNALNAAQVGLLLRNLLQLPKEIVQLLAMLANLEGADTQQLLKQLLTQDVQVALPELQELLQEQLKNGESKLVKLLQTNQLSFTGGGRGMGELMTMISQMSSKVAASPADALQTTLALYLPFYPLEAPQRFTMWFEQLQGEGEEADMEECQLVIFIETAHLGSFRIAIGTARQTQLTILVEHDAQATAVLTRLEADVKAGMQQEGTPPPVLLFQPRTHPQAPSSEEGSRLSETSGHQEKPAVAIHPVGGVSVVALHAAYLITRVILELDNRTDLHERRAAQITPD